jgi:hypothetical protein
VAGQQDLLAVQGDLSLTANSSSKMTIDIVSLGMGDFSPTSVYEWVIATTASDITGFDASGYQFVTTGFSATGTFALTQSSDGANSLLVLTYSGAAPSTWNWTGAGTEWTSGGNWAAGTEPGMSHVAIFDAATANEATVSTTASAGGLEFRTAGWHINGAGTLTLGSSGLVSSSLTSGTNTITPNVTLASSQTWRTDAGNTVAVNGAFRIEDGVAMAKTGAGTVTVSGAGTYGVGSSLVVSAGRMNLNGAGGSDGARNLAVTVDNATLGIGATQYLSSLTLTSGARAAVTVSPINTASTTVRVNTLVIDGTSQIDLTNNNLIADRNSTTLAQVQGWVKAAQGATISGFPSWNGASGIMSSTASGNASHATTLGVRDQGVALVGVPNLTSVEGVPVTSNDIIVKYTYWGDLNLDGKVDVLDYNLFTYNWTHTQGLVYEWATGDLDMSGTLDVADYNLFVYGFTHQSGALGGDDAVTPAMLTQMQDLVTTPEPATLVLLALGGVAVMARRRSRKA